MVEPEALSVGELVPLAVRRTDTESVVVGESEMLGLPLGELLCDVVTLVLAEAHRVGDTVGEPELRNDALSEREAL